MRYRLRTLLIVVTLVSIPLARIACLKRMAAMNRRSAEQYIEAIAGFQQNSHDDVQAAVELAVSHGEVPRLSIPKNRFVKLEFSARNGGIGVINLDEAAMENWGKAIAHTIVADRYERAVYRPWTRVKETVEQD
jgi:hypothetical protein